MQKAATSNIRILRPADKGFARICPAATGHDVAIPSKDVGAKLQQGNVPFAGEGERQWKVEKL